MLVIPELSVSAAMVLLSRVAGSVSDAVDGALRSAAAALANPEQMMRQHLA